MPKFKAAGAELRQDWDNIKATGEAVRNGVVNAWEGLKNRVGAIIDTVKGKIDSFRQKFEDLKSSVSSAIDRIREKFNFSWSLPHIKLPHFKVQGGQWPYGLGGQGYLPRISVDWYKKAYNNPVMFTRPTVLQTPQGYKGFGDGSGAEIVLGLDRLRELVGSQRGGYGTVNITINQQPGQDARQLAREVQRVLVAQAQQRSAAHA